MDDRYPTRIVAGLGELPRPFAGPPEPEVEPAEPPGPDPVEQAYERGRREGLAEGQRSFAKQAAELRCQVTETLKQLSAMEQQLLRRHEATIIDLALEAASRIVRERIAADDPVAARAVRQAIAALPASGPLTVRLHPDDLDSVQQELGDEAAREQIELLADKNVLRGGCVVEGCSGTVDGTIETATDAIRTAARARPESS